MGRNYVSFDRKSAEARVRAERKRRERDRLKTEEAAIWDHLVAEQLEAARSRSARQEQPKTKQRKRRPSATEEGERALKQAIVLLDDYAEIEAKRSSHGSAPTPPTSLSEPAVILSQQRRRRSRWGGPCGNVEKVEVAVEEKAKGGPSMR